MINPKLGYVLLFVQNPLVSADFYKKILGLVPVELSSTFALFILNNGVKLGLWSYKTAEPKVTAQAGAMEITFIDEDVDKIYQEWVNLSIPIIQVPTEMDFGRTFVALDPDGHRIRICKMKEK